MEETGEIVDAFISYQSADEAFAKKLAGGIEAYSLDGRRLKVFFAPWDIKPGTNIVAKMDEGLVLKGERFSWAFHKSPNLGRDSAKRLLEKALALYNQHTQVKPSRVVVHKSSKYTDEELKGFEEALADVHQRDFLTIARKEKRIRFFRLGYNPIIRGTKIAFPDGTWLLYTKAYIPFLRVYPGPRVPLPIEIIQHIGDTPPETLSEEILMLTKLNVNSADFCSHLPITLEFSRKVGSILKELPPGITPQNKYLFYM